MPATISAVIIAKDEAANIRRCLDSIKWVDEIIVVVDPGSTDGTQEICAACNCRLLTRAWDGYAAQKNYAMDQATGDWVLSLDADEELSEELSDEIRLVPESGSPWDAYFIPRQNMFLGKPMRHGGWYPDYQLRFLKRGIGKFKEVPLHEHIIFHDQGVRVGRLRNPLVHYTYPTIADFSKKADRYAGIVAASRAEKGHSRGSLIFHMSTAVPLKFLEIYIYKGGWRDGVYGFVAAVLMSFRVFTTYAREWEAVIAEKQVHGNT